MEAQVLDYHWPADFHSDAIDYSFLAATVVLFYNYILTIRREVSHMWFSRWSPTKVLFLLTRYLPFPAVLLVLNNKLGGQHSTSVCISRLRAVVWMFLFEMNIAETILALRTWAVWQRNMRVGIALIVIIVASSVAETVYLYGFIQTLRFAPPPSPQFMGCYIVFTSSVLFALYIPFMIIQLVFLTLIVIRAYYAYKVGGVCTLSHVVYLDGITFYIYILSFSIANTIIILVLPHQYSTMLLPMEGVIYSVLTTQIVLDIREVAMASDDTNQTEVSGELQIVQSLEDPDDDLFRDL